MIIEYYRQQNDMLSIMKELGLSYKDTLVFLESMNMERWVVSSDKSKLYEKLTDEQIKELHEMEKVFDIFMDFDAYYADFIEFYRIDLIDTDIDYIKFKFLLNSLFDKETSVLAKRISYRHFKRDKNNSPEYNNGMQARKDLYSFHNKTSENIYNRLRGDSSGTTDNK